MKHETLEARYEELTEEFGISAPERLDLALLREEQAKPSRAVPTCLPTWNGCCRGEGGGEGLAPGWFVVVAGATGAGKTMLGLNVVSEALRNGEHVLYLSLEMGWKQLVTRLRAIVTGTDIRRLEWGDRFDINVAKKADKVLTEELPGALFYNRFPVWRLDDVKALMEAYAELAAVRFFVVDYLQLVSPGGRERIYEATMQTAQQLRYAAQSLDAVCVALSQYNRSTSANRSDPPIVQGLLGGSSIENDASQVLLLDHTRRKRDDRNRIERSYLLLAKNRNGPQCEIPIEFDYRTLRVREAKPDEEGEWP